MAQEKKENTNTGGEAKLTMLAKERFGLEPGDENFAATIMALSNDSEYGTKPEKPKPQKIKKQVIAKPKQNKIQQGLEEEKARRDKYTGGVGGWFSK
jgi:hypothetical protein